MWEKTLQKRLRKFIMEKLKVKSIRGETTKEQAEELIEEGIPIAKLPWTSREDA